MMGTLGRGASILVSVAAIAFLATPLLSDNDANVPPKVSAGTFKGIVTISDSEHWEANGEGCIGAGDLSFVEAGKSVIVRDNSSSKNRTEGTLVGGRQYDGGSCQFAFEADAFTADTYLITVGNESVECDAGDLTAYVGGLLVEVMVEESGLYCRSLD